MASCTATAFVLIAVLLACGAYANAFSCGDLDEAACEAEFITEFTADFKPLYLKAVQKFFSTYIDIGKVVSTELPADDALKPQLDEAISKVSKDLESLNANTDDINKMTEIISRTMDYIGLDTPEGEKKSEEFLQIAESHNFKQSLLAPLREMQMETAKLWADKYAGLNDGDIEVYGIFDELMEEIRRPDSTKCKFALLSMASQLLAYELRMDYFETVARLQFVLKKTFKK